MCTCFKTETDVTQNVIDDFFSKFDCQRTFTYEEKNMKEKKNGITGLISEKKGALCIQNLTKERKQPPVVIL